MSKPLRILYTINNLHTAGMKLVVADLVRHLDRTQFTPLIAVGQKTRSSLEQELENICQIIQLPLRVSRRPKHLLLPRLLNSARQLRRVADLAHSFDYASDWTEGLAMKIAGVPWVAEKTNLAWNERRWWLRSFLAARIVCLSRAQMSMMSRWSRKITMIPTGVELEKFASAKPLSRQNIGADETDILVASVAHLVPVKGHVDLIRAVAAVAGDLPKLKLLLAGQGEKTYVNDLKNLASSLGLTSRIIFLGPDTNVPALLKACDGKILATRNEGRREAFGAVLVEAMAAGLPVVSTKSGGPQDIVIDGETGWLVEAVGWEPLAQALRELYVDANRRRAYGLAGLHRARMLFNGQLMTRRYENVYKSVMGISPHSLEFLGYN